ncbi:DUF4345 domain-containing protein [Aureibacter tunicatorum]|uniref:DUF4345 domain-containing protein n=1 Tax=Aureibacter tunicatorum TaxID=866807 RepID=A0AAE4BTN8_9BACT|nr:DUF4345 domain-containing protein [Aureibacter tunicatorum]MDR6239998.1 hypothetical protein [Aureibacter tunicatorum]BDD04470.1 hypothetical protein AUTU_19530 [Aureibacter tunicatorum]
MEIFSIITLALSGLLLLMVGTMRLVNPIKTFSNNSEIILANQVDILNEARGTSAMMLLGGLIILMGTIVSPQAQASHLVAVLIFFGFGVGRVVSMAVDGKPNKKLIQGLISEFLLGSLNLIALFFFLKN